MGQRTLLWHGVQELKAAFGKGSNRTIGWEKLTVMLGGITCTSLNELAKPSYVTSSNFVVAKTTPPLLGQATTTATSSPPTQSATCGGVGSVGSIGGAGEGRQVLCSAELDES